MNAYANKAQPDCLCDGCSVTLPQRHVRACMLCICAASNLSESAQLL
jgi:hypothetical protein